MCDGFRHPVEQVGQQPLAGIETEQMMMPCTGEDLAGAGQTKGNAVGAGQLEEVREVPDKPAVPDETDHALVEELAALRKTAPVGAVPGKHALPVCQVRGIQPELDREITPDCSPAEHASRRGGQADALPA